MSSTLTVHQCRDLHETLNADIGTIFCSLEKLICALSYFILSYLVVTSQRPVLF